MNDIRIGIIGIGNMGSAHLYCVAKGEIKGLRVTAICDINLEKLKAKKEMYPDLDTFEDYKELINSGKVDAVLIAVPHPLHAEIASYALENGKHTLLEKPADISFSKVERLNAIAKRSDKVFGIMFNQRTNDLFSKAREMIKNGELGELKRTIWIITNWYRTQHYYDSGSWRATWKGEGGGVLLNQAPHNLDLWQWICGMPNSVTAFCNVAKYHNIEVEDEATIYTTYENGATGVFITSTGDSPGTNRLEISGTKGKIVIENGLLKHWRLLQDEREVCFTSDKNSAKIENEYFEYKTQGETAHKGILQNFTNGIIHNEPLLAPGIEGINELTISNAAYLSSWKGNVKVSLPLEGDEFDKLLGDRAENSSLKEENESSSDGKYSKRWQVRW